jgi:hypothetical protein
MLRIASMWRLTRWTVPVLALGALALTSVSDPDTPFLDPVQ